MPYLGTSFSANEPYNRFRRWIGTNQEKSDIFKPSRFEPLYQPYFGFWLFAWLRCGRIVQRAEKDPGTKITRYYLRRYLHRVILAAGVICAQNRPKHLYASWVYFGWKNYESKYRSPSVFVISIEPGFLSVVLKKSLCGPSLWQNRFYNEWLFCEKWHAT